MPVEGQTCANCRYWVEFFRGDDEGHCRRHAPARSGAMHPQTHHDHWCGEWGPLPVPQSRRPLPCPEEGAD